jgi:TonB family protein
MVSKSLSPRVAFAISAVLSSCLLSHASPPPKDDPPPPAKPIKVFQATKNISAPELIPIDLSKLIETNCTNRMAGDVELATIVDPGGSPNDILVIQKSGADLERLALEIASREKFKPGQKDGMPVAVSTTINMHLDVCIANVPDEKGNPVPRVRPFSQPVQNLGPASDQEPATFIPYPPETDQTGDLSVPLRIGGDVKAPVPIHTPAAEFSDEAKRRGIQGACLISLIVDAQGIPRDLVILKPLGHGLDANALEAVKAYRFKPATRNGRPVPVRMEIIVNFKLY